MRELKWENLFLDRSELFLEQSKRRSQVFLPISEDLNFVEATKGRFGFQPYVCPKIKPVQGVYVPYVNVR